MREATRITAAALGTAAGIAGLEHGIFEILQGNIPPSGLVIASMGPPCIPEETWNGCEPALTILPSFLYSGILTVMISLAILVWSLAFIQRRRGGLVLILLSIVLLLFGGGFFPPIIGISGGAAGTQINRPIRQNSGGISSPAAWLWPWPLVILVTWLLVMFPLGTFFNDFLQGVMLYGMCLIISLLPLSIFTAHAYDARR
jgi:hypothetical protein